MDIHIEFNWKTALQAANLLVFQHTGKYLSDLEVIILRGAWDNHTYEQIAEAEGYTTNYLCKDVGCKLWGNLSTALKEKVSKKNFKAALHRRWKDCTQSNLFAQQTQLAPTVDKLVAESSTSLHSPFYIERSPIESICYETILKPGSLIRIKGAKWMGKTSLVELILNQGKLQSQKTVYLDFASVNREIFEDFNNLLGWLSVSISRQLNIDNKLEQCWNKTIIKENNKYSFYFEKHILSKAKGDIVLALDNIDRLLISNSVFKAFSMLLHSWHEKGQTHHLWSRLKLILTHSTKTSIPLDVEKSPFNAGVPILLEDFNPKQVETLASLYQLDWEQTEIEHLMNEVGGHPYLLRLAMYEIKNQSTVLSCL